MGLPAGAHKPGHATLVVAPLPCWGAITDPCVTCVRKGRKTHSQIPLRFMMAKESGPSGASSPQEPPPPLRPDGIGWFRALQDPGQTASLHRVSHGMASPLALHPVPPSRRPQAATAAPTEPRAGHRSSGSPSGALVLT